MYTITSRASSEVNAENTNASGSDEITDLDFSVAMKPPLRTFAHILIQFIFQMQLKSLVLMKKGWYWVELLVN